MDELNAQPLQVKALIVVVMASLVFAGFYFLLLEDVRGSVTTAEAQRKTLEDKVVALKRYEDASQLKKLKLKEEQMRKRLEVNRKLLPKEEKIADLFQQMARRAQDLGLELGARTKLAPEYEDYVKKVLVKMEITGTFPAVVKYLRSLTQKDMRLTTISDLHITSLPFKDIMPKVTRTSRRDRRDASGRMISDDGNAARELLSRLDTYNEAKPRAKVKAQFTVTAYTYTGELAPKNKKQRRRRRRRRR